MPYQQYLDNDCIPCKGVRAPPPPAKGVSSVCHSTASDGEARVLEIWRIHCHYSKVHSDSES